MNKILSNIESWLLSIAIAFIFVFLLKTFIGMPTTVKGSSMVPTFFQNDKLVISTWSTNFNTIPNRGDIVTFEAPSIDFVKNANLDNPIAVYKKESKTAYEKILYYGLGICKKSYIKRVIGLPGEHVKIQNGKVYINDKQIEENYLDENTSTNMALGGEFNDITVPYGFVYVLGDNRENSADSRRFGCIPIKKIQGKVVVRWWPLKKAEII